MIQKGQLLSAALACVVAAGVAAPAAAAPASVRLVVHGDVSRAARNRLQQEAEAARDRVASWLELDTAGAPVTCHIYPTLEAKGLATGYTLPAHALPVQGEVYAVAEPGFGGELGREVAAVLLWRAMGAPGSDAFAEGFATACAAGWRGRGADYWAARLAEIEDAGDLDWLLGNRSFHAESPLVRRALAGSFAGFLARDRGVRGALALWREGVPKPERPALEAHWRRHLAALRRENPAAPARGNRVLAGFQRGFCFAHEGYRIRDGYMSAEADRALGRLAGLGVNSVSLTPFSFLRSPARPAPFPFSSGPGAENDESVVHAALAARGLGMTIVLKPHVWVRGGWPGEIAMETEAQWGEFFGAYERWIRHYALLAEMYEMDVLCVGVEMSRATVGHEPAWVSMVQRLRTVYGGAITYAANWWEEYEEVGFWNQYDYIGIDCYYPLNADSAATDADLARGARDVLDRIEAVAARHQRPVLITEVGFASRRAPWVSPHEEVHRGAADDGRAQARCYEAFLSALQDRKRIAGVYFWKWPSYLADGGRGHTGFTPNGKPAEEVVKRWYLGPLAR